METLTQPIHEGCIIYSLGHVRKVGVGGYSGSAVIWWGRGDVCDSIVM